MDIKQLVKDLLQAARNGGSSIRERGHGLDGVGVGASVGVLERLNWKTKWKIEKYHGDSAPENLFAVEEFPGNLLLNEGITELLTLLIGGGGTAFNNANTRLGVGDSTTAAAATQTALQAAVNKIYKGMDATYPQVAAQTVTFRATFGNGEAAWAWEEYSIMNGADEGTAKNLNRKVEDHGTKASADTWVLTLTVTIS